MTRHYITFRDLSKEEYEAVFQRAAHLKKARREGRYHFPHLAGRSVGMIFNKNSTRTRVSFESAITELGGHAIVLAASETQISRGEAPSHTARVLSRYLSALVIRTYEETELTDLAAHATIPIINGLTNQRHPCQVLTDVFTLVETLEAEKLEDQIVAWIGDGHNMANTWLEAAAVFGFGLHLACPQGYQPDKAILAKAQADNPKIKLFDSPLEAVKGARAVNTDVFTSMGQEKEIKQRLKDFAGYQVTKELMAKAAPQAIFLHCLPAHIGEEVTEEVLESPASLVFEEAENRLHAQKALLEFLIPSL
ncbi:MAG: ornithine carbamoyltransferase [Deltaproteobacteria bacterium]|jgi:ornithine carbamoyltransferase|nr:ornithine carbamoyltransferase [Deltaproteobacteria bacterium]